MPARALSSTAITACEMREVDRIVTDEYGIDLIQMMENAGNALADLSIHRFSPQTVVVLAGAGGNGGGGLVAARHLANRGVTVQVVLTQPAFDGVPGRQLRIVHRMGIPIIDKPTGGELVIDALIGYGLRGNPSGRTADLVAWANQQDAPVLSLDTPSGLDATLGLPSTACVRATSTLTLGLPKTGLRHAAEVGELYLADIGIPPQVYRRFGLQVPNLFARSGNISVPTKQCPTPRFELTITR